MAEGRGVKRDCSFLSAEHPLGTGTVHSLKLDLGDDYPYELLYQLKGVMINQPGLVAAIGGIPDELKIKDGISFSYPSPVFKIPKTLPEDPTECYTAMQKDFEDDMVENDQTNALYKAYSEAVLRFSKKSDKDESQDNMINEQQPPNPSPSLLEVVSKELMEEGGLQNLRNKQLPPTMVEVNIAVPPAGNPIPTNKPKVSKWGDYLRCKVKTRKGYIREFLRRVHCDGSMEVIYLKAVLVNKPGVVIAVGGIPDDLKIEGAISFSFPYPIFKLPKRMPLDPTEKQKAVYEYQKEAVLKYGTRKAFIQAYNKAVGSSSIFERLSEEKGKSNDTHPVPPTMVEVNLAEPIRSRDHIKDADLMWVFLT